MGSLSTYPWVRLLATLEYVHSTPWGSSTPDSGIGWAAQRRKTNPTLKSNARKPYSTPEGSNSMPERRPNAKKQRPDFQHWIGRFGIESVIGQQIRDPTPKVTSQPALSSVRSLSLSRSPFLFRFLSLFLLYICIYISVSPYIYIYTYVNTFIYVYR